MPQVGPKITQAIAMVDENTYQGIHVHEGTALRTWEKWLSTKEEVSRKPTKRHTTTSVSFFGTAGERISVKPLLLNSLSQQIDQKINTDTKDVYDITKQFDLAEYWTQQQQQSTRPFKFTGVFSPCYGLRTSLNESKYIQVPPRKRKPDRNRIKFGKTNSKLWKMPK